MAADEDIDVSASGFPSSIGTHHLYVMYLLGEDLREVYFFELLEDTSNLFSRNSLGELFEIFKADRDVFWDEIGSFPKVLDCLDAHVIEFHGLFAPDSPDSLEFFADVDLLLPLEAIQFG